MTTQAKEGIIFDGVEYFLISPPLMPDSIMQEKKSLKFYTESTACWRGYVGTWEIKDNKLYLVDFRSPNYELARRPPIFADWITDKLMFNTSKTYEGEVSRYITQTHLNVASGLVISSKNIKEDKLTFIREKLRKYSKSPSHTENKLQSFLENDDD